MWNEAVVKNIEYSLLSGMWVQNECCKLNKTMLVVRTHWFLLCLGCSNVWWRHNSCLTRVYRLFSVVMATSINCRYVWSMQRSPALYSKAFDKVAHNRLAHKLYQYGIRGTTLRWIECFLSGRSQCVVVEGCKSPCAPVTSGVPQAVFTLELRQFALSERKSNLANNSAIIFRQIWAAGENHFLVGGRW